MPSMVWLLQLIVHSFFVNVYAQRVLNRFFRIQDFPYLKAGIQDFKAKWERSMHRMGMPSP